MSPQYVRHVDFGSHVKQLQDGMRDEMLRASKKRRSGSIKCWRYLCRKENDLLFSREYRLFGADIRTYCYTMCKL